MAPARVLVVDDDPLTSAVLARVLERSGCEVTLHKSGFGLAAAVRSARPHVIVLDLQMPGLGGAAAVLVLRDVARRWQMAEPKLLLYSGSSEAVVAAAARSLCADGWLTKGVDHARIVAEVERLCAPSGRVVGA